MSRIGKKVVPIPEGVEVTLEGRNIMAKGSKGELQLTVSELLVLEKTDEGIAVSRAVMTQMAREFWGMTRSLIDNIILGVSVGFKKELELKGVGYRVQLQGQTLKLSLGFSHDINYTLPEGIGVECPSSTEIVISGIDKQRVGQVAAEIRSYRLPEPYKGKGIHYKGDFVFRKEGKKK